MACFHQANLVPTAAFPFEEGEEFSNSAKKRLTMGRVADIIVKESQKNGSGE
jgi:hypothetical protein